MTRTPYPLTYEEWVKACAEDRAKRLKRLLNQGTRKRAARKLKGSQ